MVKITSKKWWKQAGARAFHAVWQTMLPLIPAGMAIYEIDWKVVIGVSLSAGVLSLVKSLAKGMPEEGVE